MTRGTATLREVKCLAFMRRQFLRAGLGIVAILPVCALSCAGSPPEDLVRFGTSGPALVDLSRVDFNGTDGEVLRVPTQWDFYWLRFIDPADFADHREPPADARFTGMFPWTGAAIRATTPRGSLMESESEVAARLPDQGFATYRMRLRLPRPGVYSFRTQQQYTAFRLYADGQLKVVAGRAAVEAADSEPERKPHNFTIETRNAEVELVLHVSNFHAFRGGLRGDLVIGEPEALQRYVNRVVILDSVLLGFLIAVFLYHLAFFVIQPREVSFLWFAMLCLTFAIRAPLWNEKIIYLVWPDLSWEMGLRILGSMHIVTPPLMMSFLRSVYSEAVPRKVVAAYVAFSLPFLFVNFFDIRYLAPAMYVLYLIIIFPMLFHAGYVTVRMSLRGSAGARFMSLGILLSWILGFYAMFLSWRAGDGAPVALTAFAVLVLLQAVGLGRTYRDNLDARATLRNGLLRSREALAAQRKDLEINLHDSLGGALTDLKVLIDRGLENAKTPGAIEPVGLLTSLRVLLDRTNRMFRGQLLFMEDLELAARDPVIGLRMMLLRRYSDAEREIDFDFAPDAIAAFRAAMSDDRWRMGLLQLARELCTNDLKYGVGESAWSFSRDATPRSLRIVQSNQIAASHEDVVITSDERPLTEDGATLARRATERVENMGGGIRAEIDGDRFRAEIRLPYP